jgi:hypothetical protein
MPATASIKPTAIAKDLGDDEVPETPYNWAKQARGDSVHPRPRRVVKQQRVRVRRASGKLTLGTLKEKP